MAGKSYEIDMCSGPLLGKILQFSFPLLITGLLHLCFTSADVIVVGQFAGKAALAAVGASSPVSGLIVNVFMGLSVGSNVLVARYYGAKRYEDISKIVHTSITISLVVGIFLATIGLFAAKPLLSLLGTPDDVLDMAATYLRIYFTGMPIVMIYNFGGSILRATGDTKRPMYYLMIGGVTNVVLNLIFVIVFHMDAAGVALATVLSQGISAALTLANLAHNSGPCHLNFRKLRIHKDALIQIAKIGLPAGLQGSLSSIAGALIQSTINSYGSAAIAGNTAACHIEGFVYIAMNTFYHTALNFISQNLGARKFERITKTLRISLSLVTGIGVVLGVGVFLGGRLFLRIFNTEPDVIDAGMIRLACVCAPYFVCGLMETMVGAMRGLGKSLLPTVLTVSGTVGLKIVWLYTIYQWSPSLQTLYLAFPVTYGITALILFGCFVACFAAIRRQDDKREESGLTPLKGMKELC